MFGNSLVALDFKPTFALVSFYLLVCLDLLSASFDVCHIRTPTTLKRNTNRTLPDPTSKHHPQAQPICSRAFLNHVPLISQIHFHEKLCHTTVTGVPMFTPSPHDSNRLVFFMIVSCPPTERPFAHIKVGQSL